MIFFVLMLLAFIPAIIASSKGRSGFGWWLNGLGLFPIALVHSIVAEDLNRKPCPFCAERILNAAKVCPHCQRELPVEAAPQQPLRRFAGVEVVDNPTANDAARQKVIDALAVGDKVALERESGIGVPSSVRVETNGSPLGHLIPRAASEILPTMEGHRYNANVENVSCGRGHNHCGDSSYPRMMKSGLIWFLGEGAEAVNCLSQLLVVIREG